MLFITIFGGLADKLTEYAESTDGKALLNNRGIVFVNAYASKSTVFPYCTLEEKSNVQSKIAQEVDLPETLTDLLYEFNVYDNNENRVEVCNCIKEIANNYFRNLALTPMRFKRIAGEPIPNIADTRIYRYVTRYKNN